VKPRLPPRRTRRDDPRHTRARLVLATAREIEGRGYEGTDSNRIARAAGYSPGTFYRHFNDKREALLAAHHEWVDAEWEALDALVAGAGPPTERAAAIVDFLVGHHRRWRRLRASLRALVATDAEARRRHREMRRRQLARMNAGPAAPRARRAAAALLLLEVERIADALADGELVALGVEPRLARRHLVDKVVPYLG